jgi:phospholipid-binding lipoprotein MlaA
MPYLLPSAGVAEFWNNRKKTAFYHAAAKNGRRFMKSFIALITLCIILTSGCAHSPRNASIPEQLPAALSSQPVLLASNSDLLPAKPSGKTMDAINDEYRDDENLDYADDTFKSERVEIADPIEPFNRAMYHFNDKMYFWVLKPVAQGYNTVVPEPARIGVKNFFSNLGFPARFLSLLLQADFSGAATELGRFTINTLWGVGGMLDPSSGKELNLVKQDADLGQTLGVYGIGHGFYIVWPIYGPSSPRDTLTIAGDRFLYPVSYIDPWYAWLGVWSYEKINYASLRIGEYESLKGAAIDPYISMRDAYIQYRLKEIKERKTKSLLFKAPNADNSAADSSLPKE